MNTEKQRKRYIEDLDLKLAAWRAEIDCLAIKAEEHRDTLRAFDRDQLEVARRKREELERRLRRANRETTEAWPDAHVKLEIERNSLEEAMRLAREVIPTEN